MAQERMNLTDVDDGTTNTPACGPKNDSRPSSQSSQAMEAQKLNARVLRDREIFVIQGSLKAIGNPARHDPAFDLRLKHEARLAELMLQRKVNG